MQRGNQRFVKGEMLWLEAKERDDCSTIHSIYTARAAWLGEGGIGDAYRLAGETARRNYIASLRTLVS